MPLPGPLPPAHPVTETAVPPPAADAMEWTGRYSYSEHAPPDETLEPAELEAEAVSGKKIPASARRRAAEILVSVWIDLARDLALAGSGGLRSVRDPDLIEELTAAAAALSDGAAAASLAGTERAATLLANNASPELVLDVLALDWPRRRRVA